jgi:hypothetical protein
MSYYINRIRNSNYCVYKCLNYHEPVDNTSIPAYLKNTGILQLKIQNGGGTPQFRKYTINQFGRYNGTGGKPLSNFP